LRTTARITALRPGQSPPPVRSPMRMGAESYAEPPFELITACRVFDL
jgi:hypothetical protein